MMVAEKCGRRCLIGLEFACRSSIQTECPRLAGAFKNFSFSGNFGFVWMLDV